MAREDGLLVTPASAAARKQPAAGRHAPFVMLHIGKTGGSVIKDLIARDEALHGGAKRIRVRGHKWTLPDLAALSPRPRFIFFLRDPVERAVSGFLSRLRKGQPRYFLEWTPDEVPVFERFPTPDALGRGLARGDPHAHAATQVVMHVKRRLSHYLGSVEALRQLEDRIAFIGAQEHLDADVRHLSRITGIAPGLSLSSDPVTRHAAPSRADFALSREGRAGFEAYLADDMPIHAEAMAMRARLIDTLERTADD